MNVNIIAPKSAATVRAFHGFHIHADDNRANGDGCQAEPAAPSSTWFLCADGHLKTEGQVHAGHDSDMPPLYLDNHGRARTTFLTDRFNIADLDGRVAIVHAGPDNLANIPVGADPSHYTPNSADALERTRNTGNAGDRLACGEIAVR